MSTPAHDTTRADRMARDDPSGRLAAYTAKTQTPLDLAALMTLWIVLVPPGDFGPSYHASAIALFVRLGLSVIYGIDLAIRAMLADRHWRYITTHPLSIVVVLLPPVRVIFSVRLVTSLFRRGHLERFLLAATILLMNGAIVVFLYERHAPGSNIHTLGQSIWWSVTTVTTVGYGDYFPVTTQGRVAAGCIMAIGLLTLAVVTAQVSSSFVEQATRRRQALSASATPTPEVTLGDLAQRLSRIEELLAAMSSTES